MSLIKKLGVGIIIAFSLYVATPIFIDRHYESKLKSLKKDKAFMKTFELADKDHNGFIHPVTELHSVKILSGAGPNCNKSIDDFTLKEYEKYLDSRGYVLHHGAYRKKGF